MFCILLSVSIFFNNNNTAKAVDVAKVLEIAKKILDIGVGDGLVKECTKWFDCDAYEDTSLTDQVTGLFSSNEKIKKCAANSITKNISRTIGVIVGGIAGGGALGAIGGGVVGNIVGNGLQCLQILFIKDSANAKAQKYRVCLDSPDDGHPLPLTDKQIAKILYKTNQWPTVGNIVNQYKKLCIQTGADISTAKFYGEGDSFDNVYIEHAQGYAYVMCASVVSACPCIFNLQHGKIDEPEYEKDEENGGVIKMREDGSLIFGKITGAGTKKPDDNYNRANEIFFQQHYAKHCRLIRYQEAYEQSNDLASIFDEACFDMHGFSKYNANITAGVVQCFENTARNIFEKPIMSVKVQNTSDNSALEWYKKDSDYINSYYKKIKNKLNNISTYEQAVKSMIQLTKPEILDILKDLQKLWFENNATYKVEYACAPTTPIGTYTTIYNKYVKDPSKGSTKYCCEASTSLNNSITCFNDVYDRPSDLKPSITPEQETLSLAMVFEELTKVEILLAHIQNLKAKASKSAAQLMQSDSGEGFGLTLFDILRNRLKVIATIALVLWIVLLGWKLFNGDLGFMNVEKLGEMAVKVFFCYMVVFSEEAKNYIFNLSIQTAQGVGLAIHKTMEGFRTQRDNKYNKHCNFSTGSYVETAIVDNTYDKVAGSEPGNKDEVKNITKYVCQSWEKLVQTKDKDGQTHYECVEYQATCGDQKANDGSPYNLLMCTNYYKDYDGKDSQICKIGECHAKDKAKIFPATIQPTGKKRNADSYVEVQFDHCTRSKKLDGSYYDNVKYNGCKKYETFYGNQVCVQHSCMNIDYRCDKSSKSMEKLCKRYDILEDGSEGECLDYVCRLKYDTFLATPAFERPYKRVGYYSRDENGVGIMKYYIPKCHKYASREENTIYSDKDPYATLKYSASVNDYIYVCPEKGKNGEDYTDYVMDDGYRIDEYIEHGIIENSDNGILVCQSLLSDFDQKKSNQEKKNLLRRTPVRTAVATVDHNGLVEEYNFIDSGKAQEGFQRAKYRTYLRSIITAKNKKVNSYPKFKKYGVTRNYDHISFWDSMDCKIIQFISMQGMDGGFTEQLEDVIAAATDSSKTDVAIMSGLNGMLQFFKFMFMCFPFGILVFMLMFALGAMLFMLVARAAQQYCVCVFNLVLIVYLSPFVFVLWLFEQTKDVLDTWLDDLKANITGSCVPFISISMFLFIVDFILFGDSDKYASMNLFTSTGAVNPDCYEGHLSEAPIACLSKRLLKGFSIWQNVIYLLTGNWNGIFESSTWVMMGYLLLRALFGAALMMSLVAMLDKMEEAIYKVVGNPDANIGAGFNETAKEAMTSGAKASLTAGKFALKTTALGAGAILSGIMAMIPGAQALATAVSALAAKAVAKVSALVGSIPGAIAGGIKSAYDWVKNKITGKDPDKEREQSISNISNNTLSQINQTTNNYNSAVNNLNAQRDGAQQDYASQRQNIENDKSLNDADRQQKLNELNAQEQQMIGRYEQQLENMKQQYQSAVQEHINNAYDQLITVNGGTLEQNSNTLTQQLEGALGNQGTTETQINESHITVHHNE